MGMRSFRDSRTLVEQKAFGDMRIQDKQECRGDPVASYIFHIFPRGKLAAAPSVRRMNSLLVIFCGIDLKSMRDLLRNISLISI